MSLEEYPCQRWQLTAYVLGELNAEVAARVEQAAVKDPALAAEINALRATVAQVAQLYRHETADIQPTQFAALQATSSEPVTSPLVVPNRATQSVTIAQPVATAVGSNRLAWIGLLAMSASLLVAVYLATPSATSWLLSQNDFKLEDNVETTVDHVLPATMPTLEATAGKLSDRVAVATDSQKERGAESESLGDVQVEFVDETGLVVARGSDFKSEGTLSEHDQGHKLQSVFDATAHSQDEIVRSDPPTSTPITIAVDGYDGSVPLAIESKAKTSGEMKSEIGSNVAQRPADLHRRVQSREAHSGNGAGGPVGGAITGTENAGSMAGDLLGSEAGRMGMGNSEEGRPSAEVAGRTLSLAEENQGDRLSVAREEGLAQLQHEPTRLGGKNSRYGVKLVEENEIAEESGAGLGSAGSELARGRREWYRQRSVDSPSTDRYESIFENPFIQVGKAPLSTFSIDVDTASYVKARQFLLQSRRLPPANAVRIEEFVNYFEYEYAGPKNDDPFGADLAVADCPWRPEHKLVRIALQATKVEVKDRPKANLVFLLDVSGSMDQPNKLPLVIESMRMLVEQLGENDRIAMVVYAGAAGCILESTTGDHQDMILGALDKLNAGGSTNGGQAIQLAYDLARDHFIPSGINRVILCTDGDFNVGVTSTDALVNLVAENAKSKIFLTVLGYGMGNTNDAMMEQISNRGNGVYGFVDSRREAQRQMVKQLAGNLMTVAKDVKIQVEFNPARVASYRLIGYENRVLAAEDFNNDQKDAGEIGAGHRVTALYEVEPVATARAKPAQSSVDDLRYQPQANEPSL